MAITLKNNSGYEATYLPEKGMTLASFKKNGIEVIDQETLALFEERRAGLGPLIGPHFHQRPQSRVPKVENESLFPEIALARSLGRSDPFSHGLGRFAEWKVETSENSITATLSGKDLFRGVPLSQLEGQDFTLTYEASLKESGLHIDYSVVSETDSVVGLHYYYRLPHKRGVVQSKVGSLVQVNETKIAVPESWGYHDHELKFELNKPADFTFYPHPHPLATTIDLFTDEFDLSVHYSSPSQANGWQLWHPQDATFVCIEPLSAQNPRKPILSASSLKVHLAIQTK